MQRAAVFLFLFLLYFAPLAFGTVEPWSIAGMEMTAAIAFLLTTWRLRSAGRPLPGIPGALPLAMLLGFMAMQLLPLPPAMVRVLSPATYTLYHPLLVLQEEPAWIPLSIHPARTLAMLSTCAAYALVYLTTIYLCSDGKVLRVTVKAVCALGISIAILAILQKLTMPDRIYWFRPTPNASPVGPWVYSNHFAGFMGMLFPLTVALFLFQRPRLPRTTGIKERLLAAMTMPGANQSLLLGTGAVLMAVSILISISRGGIITLCLAFLCFTLFSSRTIADLRTRWALVLTILVVLLVTWLGWQPIITKFGNLWGADGLNTSGRLPVLADSVRIVRSFPLFGTGFGTFIDIYPSVRTVPGDAIFDHAHNDYIELLATGGLVGFLLTAWFVLAVLITSFKTLVRRRDRYAILVTSGSLTGLLALLFHSLADFQFYNGANGLYFFFFCGLSVSAAHTRLYFRTRPTLLQPAGRKTIIPPLLAAILLLTGGTWYTAGTFQARQVSQIESSPPGSRYSDPAERKRLITRYETASALAPLDAAYPAILGRLASQTGDAARARTHYLRACMLNPTDGAILQQLALSLSDAAQERKKELLLLALERNPLNLALYRTCSDWLLLHKDPRAALSVMIRAMERIPWKMIEIVDFILPLRFASELIQAMLPEIPAAWYEVGGKLERLNARKKAEAFYLRAIALAEAAGDPQPSYYTGLHRLYTREKEEKKAIQILRQGIRALPEYVGFRILLGDYYRSQNIIYRARQEYTKALTLEPDNRTIRRRLEQLPDR